MVRIWIVIINGYSYPIGSMYAIYGNIYISSIYGDKWIVIYGNMDPINIPPMLAYIYILYTIHGSYGYLWR